MRTLIEMFGSGTNLSVLQMSARGIVIFIIAFILIRISGRRSFGLHMPLDNIITITLGALLSRAIVGASDVLPVVTCSTVIVLLHRGIAWVMVRNPRISHLVEGRGRTVFTAGNFVPKVMNEIQVCQEDIMQGVRKSALTEDLSEIERILIERNGEISVIRKPKS